MEWMVVSFLGSQRGALVYMKLLQTNHSVKNSISRRFRIRYGYLPVDSWSHWLAVGWMGYIPIRTMKVSMIANIMIGRFFGIPVSSTSVGDTIANTTGIFSAFFEF
jgi:hypothetical protein